MRSVKSGDELMPRPPEVSEDEISRWAEELRQDPNLGPIVARDSAFLETMLSRAWLDERLKTYGANLAERSDVAFSTTYRRPIIDDVWAVAAAAFAKWQARCPRLRIEPWRKYRSLPSTLPAGSSPG
jgi:hypothetical protein